MSINPKFLDELRARLNLSEVIGTRIKVTRAGREYKACCPFHHEKTPSFTINDDKQFYHCFGCGAHGDVIKFVMDHDNISFMDALEKLAAQAGMVVPQMSPQEAQKAKKQKDLYDLLEDATQFFQSALAHPQNQDVQKYLLDRGLSVETLKEFRVGYAPADGQALRKLLLDKGYTDKEMLEVGLVKASTRGGDPYVFFRDRVMFPVPDRRGRIVAFGGRILPEHIRPPQRMDFTPPKYINSTETPLFHKGSMLYGEPTARRAAAEGSPLVLVEGYMDVIACAQAGIRGALAPMGTAVTEEQIASMWGMIPDFNKTPVLCFDGDNAGRKAASRVCDRILPLIAPGKSVSFAFMPDGEDPDSLIKAKGKVGVTEILNKAIPLFDYLWNLYMQGKSFNTPEERAGVTKQLNDEVSRIADKDVQVHYRALLKERIGDKFFARKERGNYNGGQYSRGGAQNKGRYGNSGRYPIPPAVKPRRPIAQVQALFPRALLAAVINHPHIFEDVEEKICNISLKDPRLERARQGVISYLIENPDHGHENLHQILENEGYAQEIGDICQESVYVHASFCSPHAAKENVLSNWLEYWNDGHTRGLDSEIQNGWKRAFLDLDEAEEEKLRNMVSNKAMSGEEG